MDMWRNKEKTGEFVPSRLDDVLSRALKKKDSSGCVLGVGGRLGIRSVWGPADRKCCSRRSIIGVKYLEEFEERVSERVSKRMMEAMNSKINDTVKKNIIILAESVGMQVPDDLMKEQVGISDPGVYFRYTSSCHSRGYDPFEYLKEPVNCQLALLIDGTKRVVAEGFVNPSLVPSSRDNVKVGVDIYDAAFQDAPVPRPTEVIHRVKHTHGAYVEWPKTLVMLSVDEEMNLNAMSPKDRKNMKENSTGPDRCESAWIPTANVLLDMALKISSDRCRYMYTLMSNLQEGGYYSLVVNSWVFKYDEDQKVHITYNAVIHLLTGTWLTVSVIQVFIMDLSDWAVNADVSSIGFMCPRMIS